MNSKSYLQRFDESWIFEMPQGTGKSGHNPYPELLLVVKSNIDNGATPESRCVCIMFFNCSTCSSVMSSSVCRTILLTRINACLIFGIFVLIILFIRIGVFLIQKQLT